MKFAPPLIYDCSFDDHMKPPEIRSNARQLSECFKYNREHNHPFSLYLCNMKPEAPTMQELKKFIPTVCDSSFPINIHQKCFTDLFPIERLVYLTPDCKNDLLEYDPYDIFIIGAIVDKGKAFPLSLAKAKEMGLRMARLPLDRFLKWPQGTGKRLQLHTVTSMLLDIRQTNDWDKAFFNIPWKKFE